MEGCTGDQEPASGGKSSDDLTQQRIDVFDSVRLIDDDVLPTKLLQGRLFSDTDFVRGDEDVEVLGEDSFIDHGILSGYQYGVGCQFTYPLFLGALQNQSVEPRNPFGDLSAPVIQRGLWHDDEMRTGDLLVEFQISKKGDSLQSFPQTLQERQLLVDLQALDIPSHRQGYR